MNRSINIKCGAMLLLVAVTSWPLSNALAASGPQAAASAVESSTATATEVQKDEELDQVIVNGTKIKTVRDPQKVLNWLARLVGKFSYEGQVDVHGIGRDEDLRIVRGMQDCVGFGPAPAVHCTINAVWPESPGLNGAKVPGEVSNLNPAMMLYGFEPDRIGIRYMLVDNKGIAEGALGLLAADTLISKAPCVDIHGGCERSVRITADPEGKVIEMQIDVEVEHQKATSYRFVLHRIPGTAAVVVGAQAPP